MGSGASEPDRCSAGRHSDSANRSGCDVPQEEAGSSLHLPQNDLQQC